MNKLIEIVIGIAVFLIIALLIIPWMALGAPWAMILRILVGLMAIGWLYGLLTGNRYFWIRP